jgi:CD36 family
VRASSYNSVVCKHAVCITLNTYTLAITLKNSLKHTRNTSYNMHNRYYSSLADWSAARARVGGSALCDSNGMFYSAPPGASPTQSLTGFPSFESDPHLYSNAAAGALDWSQVKDLQPLRGLHQSFVDVEPVTGIAARRALRTQVGMHACCG